MTYRIEQTNGMEIFDSRGRPTVEVTVRLSDGAIGTAGVPSGASAGTREAVELRDGDQTRYRGAGVTGAVSHVNGEINDLPSRRQWRNLDEIDRALIELDGTETKNRFDDYLETERRVGARYLGTSGRVEWLASFAPGGPAELRAVIREANSPGELDDDLVAEVGWGISTALGLYDELGSNSFNLAMYGGPPGGRGRPMHAHRVPCQPESLYRSDVMWLERLHGEAAVDITPEQVADRAGGRFGR